METEKWYQKTWFTIVMLVVFFPVGLYFMWAYKKFNMVARVIITVFFAYCLFNSVINGNPTTVTTNAPATEQSTTTEPTAEPTTKSVVAKKVDYLKRYEGNTIKDGIKFKLVAKAEAYILAHPDLFPANSLEAVTPNTDTSVEFKHLQKNINNYGDKLIKVDAVVAKIEEFSDYGFDTSVIQAVDSNGNMFFTIYFGKLPDIYMDDSITIYGYPISQTSFTNLSNTTTQAIVLLDSYVTK